jgi:hypothetical protein
MLAVLDRFGYGHVTVHWLPIDLHDLGRREAALAPKYKSETTAAYQRRPET